MSLKIIFAGTPEVAVPALERLIHSTHRVVAVYTQPDRKAGRGRQLKISPVKTCALKHGLPIEQPQSMREETTQQHLLTYSADLMVVVAYGLLLPQTVLSAPRLGCVNLHFSLLPRWRGAAPIQHAILTGDKETGASVMQITRELDAGDVFGFTKTHITTDDNLKTLGDRLAASGATLLLQTIAGITAGTAIAKPQQTAAITHTRKVQKTDAAISWQESATTIDRKVRAYYGWPVAFGEVAQQTLRIWQTRPVTGRFDKAPGCLLVIDKMPVIVCGEGAIELQQAQPPGKRVMSGRDLLNYLKQG